MKKPARKRGAGSKLAFDFNKAAQKALKDHPQLKNKVMFFDAKNDNWKNAAELLLQKEASEEDVKDLARGVREARKLKTSFCQALELDNGKSLTVMVFHSDKHPLFGTKSEMTDDACTFDHELAHALTPKLEGTPSENTADAYAVLRHLQRGGDGEDMDYCGWKRAAIFIKSGTTSHLTTFTVDKILCDSQTADFMSLSPQETLAVAKDYAKKNTPSPEKLKSLSKTFGPLGKMPLQQAFRKLGEITLKADKNSDAFYLGARVLSGALQEGGVTLDGRSIVLKGKEWDKLKKALDSKIATLPANHALRRLGNLRP